MKQSRRCRVRKHNRTLKRGNKKKMRGGLFTVERDKDEWSAVLDMMKCDGASLSVISYRSLYGFILLLSIPEGSSCAQFIDENGKLVYKIVLKIVLLGDEKRAILPSFIARNKSVMFTSDFEKEVKIQEKVFNQTNAMNHKPITLGVACHKVFSTNLRNDLLKANTFLENLSGLGHDGDTILVEVIKYINSLINMANYRYNNNNFTNRYGVAGLGVMVMNYAGNYISDGTNYQIMTLYQMTYTPNYIHAKNKCFEYAIAQMLILSVRFKYINIDAHESNFLTRFFQPGTSEQSLENIVTWMIDMGRLKSIDDIKGNATYTEKYNDLYDSIPGYNKRKRMSLLDNHIDFISTFDISKLHSRDDNTIKSIHKLIRIIAALDYVINEKYKYKENDRTPQCAFILEHLIKTSNIRDMINKDPMEIDIKSKYWRIRKYFNLIATNNIKSVDDEMEVDDKATTTKKTKRKYETIDTDEIEYMRHKSPPFSNQFF